jgi:hypothetical protein
MMGAGTERYDGALLALSQEFVWIATPRKGYAIYELNFRRNRFAPISLFLSLGNH